VARRRRISFMAKVTKTRADAECVTSRAQNPRTHRVQSVRSEVVSPILPETCRSLRRWFRALALLGRLPSERVDGASSRRPRNLHKSGCERCRNVQLDIAKKIPLPLHIVSLMPPA
jgi:hypothetical protein